MSKSRTQLVNLTNYCFENNEFVNIYFIKTDKSSKEFLKVFKEIKDDQTKGETIEWISESECLKFEKENLLRTKHILVFENFTQDVQAFKYIAEMKNVFILGPKVILSLSQKDNSDLKIAQGVYHIHNLFMKDLTVCFSALGDNLKPHYKKLVSYMGGIYSNALTDEVTLLITEDVLSRKYFHAAVNNIQIVRPEIIEEFWKLSQNVNNKVAAKDSSLFDKYKLKMFHKLIFSSTGLDNDEKRKLIKLIEENGGTYSSTFKTATVKVLLLREKDVENVKYKASQKHSILCLDPRWITDSVSIGYLLNVDEYLVKKNCTLKASTPTKNNASTINKFNFDNTMLSEIYDITSASSRSLAIDETQKSNQTRVSAPVRSSASRILRPSNTSVNEAKRDSTFKRPPLPLKKPNDDEAIAIPVYTASESDFGDDSDESFIQILINKTVCLYGFTNETDSMQVIKMCDKLGATLVDTKYCKPIDYVISPTESSSLEEPILNSKYFLNDWWLEESITDGRCIIPPKFHHYSVFKVPSDKHVLEDEIFVCTNYKSRNERFFIKLIVESLGGISKETLNRAEQSILISPTAEGKKYEGAISWNRTVLSAEWLIECYKQKWRCDENNYLIGKSKVSARNIRERPRDSIIPSSQDIESDEHAFMQNFTSPPNKKFDSPQTPNSIALARSIRESEAQIGNLNNLLDDIPTPERILTIQAFERHRKKKEESPRSKLLKDLLETPAANTRFEDYVSSPVPELPEQCFPPKDGKSYGFRPNASPASQWFYKRKLEIADQQYVPISESKKKALKEIEMTPPLSSYRRDFFKRRMPEYLSPDPNSPITQDLFMARVSDDMSKEASKFLNFADTQTDELANLPNDNEDCELSNLEDALKEFEAKANEESEKDEQFEFEMQRKSFLDNLLLSQQSDNKNLIDYDPNEPESMVGWSNTQRDISRGKSSLTRTKLALDDDDKDEEVNRAEIENNDDDDDDNVVEQIDLETDDMDENNSEEEDELCEKIFAISTGTNSGEKDAIAKKIIELGGKIAETDFTHLVMLKLSRSAKYFSALATGKYILHADYVNNSFEQKRFLETAEYEFGNPNYKCAIPNVDSILFNGSFRCRMMVANNLDKYKNGLFSGLTFIIIAGEKKRHEFIAVITNGGGRVEEVEEYKPAIIKRKKIDYCLLENTKMSAKVNTDVLKACNVKIENIKFIYDFLLNSN